jgi:hypothetical protein
MDFIVIWGQEYDMAWVADIISTDSLDKYIEYDKQKFEKDYPNKKILEVIRRDSEVSYKVFYKELNESFFDGGFNYTKLELDKFKTI